MTDGHPSNDWSELLKKIAISVKEDAGLESTPKDQGLDITTTLTPGQGDNS